MAEYEKKPYLRSYELVKELPNFFEEIKRLASSYDYVVAFETRTFNLMFRVLPDLENFITNNALLAEHKKLAEFFMQNGFLPKILLVTDNLQFSDTGIAKFIYMLERLIEDDLKIDSVNKYIYTILSQSLYIYSYNDTTDYLLINDGYIKKVRSLYNGNNFDVNLQLSDTLSRWEVANTTFSFSARNKVLTDFLCYDDGQVPGWTRICWKYNNETMIIYIRCHNNCISTIRIFPGRANKYSPQMTSLTLTNNINSECFNKICGELQDLFERANFVALQELISDKSTFVEATQTQLIYFLFSIIDYHEFRDNAKNMIANTKLEGDTDDIYKIACNFGLGKLKKELSELCTSTRLLTEIKQKLQSIFASETKALYISPTHESGKTEITEEIYKQINDHVNEIFAFSSTTDACKHDIWGKKISYYQPFMYHKYEGDDILSGKNEIIPLRCFFELSNELSSSILGNKYYCIAAFIAMIDNNVAELTFQFVKSSKCLYVLCHGGIMARYMYPLKLQLILPALNMVEWKFHRRGENVFTVIKDFIHYCNHDRLSEFFKSNNLPQYGSHYAALSENLLEIVEENVPMVYASNFACGNYNFENITHKPDRDYLNLQWAYYRLARQYLRLEEK